MSMDGQAPDSNDHVHVVLHGVELTWWPQARLARMAFSDDARAPDGVAAQLVSTQLEGWVAGGEPWGFLVDCSTLETAQAGWRSLWSRFFNEHRHASRIAWYGATPHLQAIIRMFATGLRASGPLVGEPFATEEAARGFLREHGIAA